MHRLTDFWKVVRLQALLMLLTVSALGALGEISIRAVHYFWDRTPIDRSLSHLVDQDEMLGWRVAPDKNETYRMTDATGTHLVLQNWPARLSPVRQSELNRRDQGSYNRGLFHSRIRRL
jgi:hypothetical protein